MPEYVHLYHGTSESVLENILANGLRPRKDTGVQGNWDIQSRSDFVYFTRAYAGYFAALAAKNGERLAIIEAKLNVSQLVPDEDYMEQATRTPEVNRAIVSAYQAPQLLGTMEERTEWFRDNITSFKDFWSQSLDGLGNAAHQGPVAPIALARVTLFDPKSNPSMYFMALDPCITVLNYAIMGAKYEALVQWLIGEPVDPEVLFFPTWEVSDDAEREKLIECANNTSGIEQIDTSQVF